MPTLSRSEGLALLALCAVALAASLTLLWPVPPVPSPPELLRLDPNRADLEALMRLPGIGPVLARRIIADRQAHGPFRRPEDLLRVKGIGPATLEKVRAYLVWGE